MNNVHFRAWDLLKERMIYDSHNGSDQQIKVTPHGIFTKGTATGVWDFQPDNVEIMASTGYVDKHNRPIFEGDMISTRDEKYEVVWEDFKFNLRGFYNGGQLIPECAFSSFSQHDFEVVGNKYIKVGLPLDI